MAVTAFAQGTQNATIDTEHFLASPDEAGTYQLYVDMDNMAAGDVVELRVYKMMLTGGTPKGALPQTYYGVQADDDLIKFTVPISTELAETNALRFSLKQTDGTGRAFDWKVLKFA